MGQWGLFHPYKIELFRAPTYNWFPGPTLYFNALLYIPPYFAIEFFLGAKSGSISPSTIEWDLTNAIELLDTQV